MTKNTQTQVLILGTGIAGLSAALKFAEKYQVILVCKSDPAEGATRYAQGGIASVWSEQDSFAEHISDTMTAGAGLCHPTIVELCVKEGPARVRELIELGVEFTKNESNPPSSPGNLSNAFDLHQEGGHGQRRILNADDLTGLAIEKALLAQVRKHPKIQILDEHIAIDLITEGKGLKRWKKPERCLGAYLLDTITQEIKSVSAQITLLATGGAGKVYLYTSNPDTSTGDGIALAYRAGARVANLEFMQFHPTCLYHPGARTFLISEALRGEGAVLKTLEGVEFMKNHHPMGSLAPRDIVARAIDIEMKRSGDKHVWLDCSPIHSSELQKKFPNIYETCLKYGIDITQQPIPVVPAAHYTCGGVLVDENAQTTIDALYAIGEVACTGLHGANRLASNSLLEAVVFSHRAVQHASDLLSHSSLTVVEADMSHSLVPEWKTGHAVEIEEQIDIAANWHEIRSLMWNYVGIVRSDRRLERALRRLALLKAEINSYYWEFILNKDLIELRNLLTVSELIVQCALLRKESRGLHYTVDYPQKLPDHEAQDTVL